MTDKKIQTLESELETLKKAQSIVHNYYFKLVKNASLQNISDRELLNLCMKSLHRLKCEIIENIVWEIETQNLGSTLGGESPQHGND